MGGPTVFFESKMQESFSRTEANDMTLRKNLQDALAGVATRSSAGNSQTKPSLTNSKAQKV